ncbi:MAG: hypothetical protein GY928_31790 [Colwellia sp.]|nr:hypothetical protein [Colwellia sp.]
MKLIKGSIVAFLALGGWFIIPSSTHHYYFDQENEKMYSVDLISIYPNEKIDSKADSEVLTRGWLFLIFGWSGILVWFVCAY